MSVSLTPRDPNTQRKPEEVLELRGEWQLADIPKTLEARLFWYTRGKGTEDVWIVATRPLSPSVAGSESIKFRLADAPYSFSGALITLAWAVELVADDEVARWEFTMSPTGAEIRLDQSAEHAGR